MEDLTRLAESREKSEACHVLLVTAVLMRTAIIRGTSSFRYKAGGRKVTTLRRNNLAQDDVESTEWASWRWALSGLLSSEYFASVPVTVVLPYLTF